jgi:hypothetical protein
MGLKSAVMKNKLSSHQGEALESLKESFYSIFLLLF